MRHTIAVAILAALVGCGKKARDDDGGSSGGSAPTIDGPTYKIKVAKREDAGAIRVTETRAVMATVVSGKKTEAEETEEKAEYVERVVTPGPVAPLKLTRAYRYAQKSKQHGPSRDLAYSGKTVVIEKKGDLHTFTVDGRQLQPADAEELVREFSGADKIPLDRRLPKSPVRVGETWQVDREVLRELARSSSDSMDPDRSTMTGKLTKAYQSADRKQWGVIELKVDIHTGAGRKPTEPEKMSATYTIETPIDGSSPERKVTIRATILMEIKQQGQTAQVTMEFTDTTTIKPVE